MHPALEKLYLLQQLDVAIFQLKRKIAALDPGTTLEAELNASRQHLQEQEHRLRTLTADLQDSELRLRSLEDKIKQFEQRLYSGVVVNPKELTALEKDIESLKRQRSQLDDQILQLWDEIDQVKQEVASLRVAYEQAQQAYQSYREEYLRQKAELEAQLATYLKKREALASEIEPVLLQRYQALQPKLGGVAVAKVEQSVCQACHTTVTAYIMTRLREDPVLITCESCGRLLYLPPELEA